jgi:glycosyltransferase involved in cell wall biosynthesis
VAVEKNIEAFLALDVPGTKYVIGDGPQRAELEMKYPAAVFLGYRQGEELARHITSADVFVFPSRTDTFGLVMLEALACGVPVAAYPVQGPRDVILSEKVGCLDDDLAKAVATALTLNRDDCRQYALGYTWERCARLFESHLARIPSTQS